MADAASKCCPEYTAASSRLSSRRRSAINALKLSEAGWLYGRNICTRTQSPIASNTIDDWGCSFVHGVHTVEICQLAVVLSFVKLFSD